MRAHSCYFTSGITRIGRYNCGEHNLRAQYRGGRNPTWGTNNQVCWVTRREPCCFIESLWISVLDVIHQGKIYSVLALWLVQSVHASTAACLCRRVGSCVHIYLWKQNLLSPWCSHFLGENIFTLPWRPQPSSKNFSAISICTSTLTGEVVMSFWWLSKAKLSVRWAVLSLTLEEN